MQKDLLILDKNTLEKQMELRYNEMKKRGIPEPERSRAVRAEFIDFITPEFEPWPGPTTGIDLAGPVDDFRIFASASPPVIQPNTPYTEPFPTSNTNPYPNNPTPNPNSLTYNFKNHPVESSDNWLGLATDIDSETPTVGIEGFNSKKAIPEWRYPIEDSQMIDLTIPDITIPPSGALTEAIKLDKKKEKQHWLKKLFPYAARFGAGISAVQIVNDFLAKAPEEPEERNKYFTKTLPEINAKFTLSSSHTGKDVCDDFAGRTFNLMETERPVVPSEGKGYVNLVHPNCHCSWVIVKKPKAIATLTRKEKTTFDDITTHIKDKAKEHKLHTVKPDGSLSKRTRGTNPMQETIGKIRHQFQWLSNEYITQAKEAAASQGGVLYLIRAATATITDHRSEGEEYRRKLGGPELQKMARTAIGNKMDINHDSTYTTDATIIDSDYDDMRKEIQMLVIENDPQINAYIENGSLSAVSINGGNPRRQVIEPCIDGCTDESCELCNVPQGIILGELDGIGMTWVVTSPGGIFWNGYHIPHAEPGIKNTVIQPL